MSSALFLPHYPRTPRKNIVFPALQRPQFTLTQIFLNLPIQQARELTFGLKISLKNIAGLKKLGCMLNRRPGRSKGG